MTLRNGVFSAAMSSILFGILAKTGGQTPQKEMPKDQAADLVAIMALEHTDAEAAKVNDVDTLISLWTDDGVLLLPRSQPVVGVTALRQLLETDRQQSANVTTLAYVENWKERRITGDDAYEWGEMSVTSRLPSGKQVSQTVYAIRVLRRVNGRWKMARSIITPAAPRSN